MHAYAQSLLPKSLFVINETYFVSSENVDFFLVQAHILWWQNFGRNHFTVLETRKTHIQATVSQKIMFHFAIKCTKKRGIEQNINIIKPVIQADTVWLSVFICKRKLTF
jgi:hypothetical protein